MMAGTAGFGDDVGGGFDDGFAMDLFEGNDMQMQFVAPDNSTEATTDDGVYTNEIVVLQTAKGVFLRFPLREIPEKKKGAVGVRGI